MFAQLPLIHGFEVAREALRLDGVDDWCALLNSFGRVSLHKSEVLEVLRIGRLEVKVCGHVAAKLEIVGVSVVIKQFLHALELVGLPFREIVLVC